MNQPPPMFVIAARVAAHLHLATLVAKQLSLTAKNARAITARAGQQAAGFTAITGFIQELATSSIDLASQINITAIAIAKQAAELARFDHANQCINKVRATACDSQYLSSIVPFEQYVNNQQLSASGQFEQLQIKLIDLVEQIRLQIRSAKVISTMSKVEAAKSGEFEQQLKVIAENIATAADNIAKELASAEQLLQQG